MQIGVHKIVLEQHGKIGIHAQRHDLSVDGGASLGEVGNTASGLKALHQHSWMNQAREEAGHSHLCPHWRKVPSKASDVDRLHAKVCLRRHGVRELGHRLPQTEALQRSEPAGKACKWFEQLEVPENGGCHPWVPHFHHHVDIAIAAGVSHGSTVHLCNAARGQGLGVKPGEMGEERSSKGSLHLPLGVGKAVDRRLVLQRGHGVTKVCREQVWARSSPLTPLDKGCTTFPAAKQQQAPRDLAALGLQPPQPWPPLSWPPTLITFLHGFEDHPDLWRQPLQCCFPLLRMCIPRTTAPSDLRLRVVLQILLVLVLLLIFTLMYSCRTSRVSCIGLLCNRGSLCMLCDRGTSAGAAALDLIVST
mmetsp:Transcript_25315/g.68774  ORF Transcript_25315/g.68774 Transcript_25315/m.68774 type:complete len:362 (-) Transcript_25315:1252-2337(-)